MSVRVRDRMVVGFIRIHSLLHTYIERNSL